MKTKADTTKLKLPGRGAGAAFVQPERVRRDDRLQAVRQLLSLGVPTYQLRRLIRRIDLEASTRRLVDQWPTVGEDRKVLQSAIELAETLAAVLRDASPRAQAQLATASLQAFKDPSRVNAVARDLGRLIPALRERLEKLPLQSRRSSSASLVSALLDIVGLELGSPTTFPESRFYKACCAVFVLAGRHSAPDRAIKAVAASMSERCEKDDGNRP